MVKNTLLFLVLFLLVFAEAASAQMTTFLVEDQIVPASSRDAGWTLGDFDVQPPIRPYADQVVPNGAGMIHPELADLDGDGPETIGVVDWVEVQVRVVPRDADDPPLARRGPTVVHTRALAKAGLLLSNGWIIDADTDLNALDLNDLHNAVLTFDEAFDMEREKIYIAVAHRNHLAVMSSRSLGAEDISDGGTITYDFSSSAEQTFGGLGSTGTGGATKFATNAGVFMMAVGNLDGNRTVNIADVTALRERLTLGVGPYDAANLDFNRAVNLGDDTLGQASIGFSTQIFY